MKIFKIFFLLIMLFVYGCEKENKEQETVIVETVDPEPELVADFSLYTDSYFKHGDVYADWDNSYQHGLLLENDKEYVLELQNPLNHEISLTSIKDHLGNPVIDMNVRIVNNNKIIFKPESLVAGTTGRFFFSLKMSDNHNSLAMGEKIFVQFYTVKSPLKTVYTPWIADVYLMHTGTHYVIEKLPLIVTEGELDNFYHDDALVRITTDTEKKILEVTPKITNISHTVATPFGTLNFLIDNGVSSPFIVNSAEKLNLLRELPGGGNYDVIQSANIDLSIYDNWVPITGKDIDYSGQDFVIRNLKIKNDGTYTHTGLFGDHSGDIDGVNITNAQVYGDNYTGAIVGKLDGDLYGSSVRGIVYGNYFTGGAVGYCDEEIERVFVGANVTGTMIVGGIVGHSTDEVDHVYSTGSVNGKDMVGGIAGVTTGIIDKSFSISNVTGVTNVGGIVGLSLNNNAASSLTSLFSGGDVTGLASVGGIVGFYTSQISNVYSTGVITLGNLDDDDIMGIVAYGGGIAGFGLTPNSGIYNAYSTSTIKGDAIMTGIAGTGHSLENSLALTKLPDGSYEEVIYGANNYVNNYYYSLTDNPSSLTKLTTLPDQTFFKTMLEFNVGAIWKSINPSHDYKFPVLDLDILTDYQTDFLKMPEHLK